MNIFPPNVNALNASVQIGDSIAVSNLFEASDLDGNPLTRFRFRDNSGVNVSGFFTVAGVRQPSNSIFQVNASQLNTVRYHAGLIESNETFTVQVGDAQRLSTLASATINTIPGNFFPPVVTPMAGSIQEREVLDPTTLFSVSDPEGNAVVRYLFVDRSANANGGHFRLNGVRMPSAKFFAVEANQLDQLEYIGGRFAQTENVGIQAYDGEFFSDTVDVAVSTLRNRFRPVVSAFNVNTGLGKVIDGESLFQFSDQDGNTPKTIGFLDTGAQPDSGFFTINGVRQNAGTFFSVPADEIGSVRYHVPNTSDSEVYRVFATDGRFSSVVSSATVSAVPRPQLQVDDFTVVLDTLETDSFSNLIQQSDAGPVLSTYQVLDQNAFGLSARLNLNGERLQQGVVHTLTAQEFADLEIEGGTAEGRFADQFLVRGNNGLFFTEWQEFRVQTDPVGPDSLDSGLDWGDQFLENGKHRITYTFIDGQSADGPYPPLPTYYPDDADEADQTTALDFAMRQDVRASLANIETYADIEFVEVPFTSNAAEATLTFGLHMDDGPFNVLAHAFLPIGDGLGSTPGDVWFDIADYPFQNTVVGAGSEFRATTLHEVGHALGFKHPFENDPALPIFVDFAEYTVMSYSRFNLHPQEPSTFMIWDVQEIQRLYGANEEYNLDQTHYRFPTGNLQTIWDAGGRDTFNMTTSFFDETINLHQGAFSSAQGVANSVSIAYGTVIENARGGNGNDTIIGNSNRNLLFGNGGDDTLEGDGGNDVLRGGARSDTYVWRTGDGRDRVDEQFLGGMDAVHIFDDTALSSIQNDLVFRRFGQDLRIDLRFDRNEGQGSIVIKNQGHGGSRVETLRLFNSAGDQFGNDIDLFSVYQQATSQAQFFRLTNQETDRGFIAVPT